MRNRSNSQGDQSEEKLTNLEVLNLAAKYLEKHGIDSPRLNAEHLLTKVLGCNRMDLYLRFDNILPEKYKEAYRKYLRKRAGHYPLQYIMGEVGFLGRVFELNNKVFIPRQETELLVEWVDEILGEERNVSFLEFGTGSGVISGSIAADHDSWRGVAFDISRDSVLCANENFAKLGVEDRVFLYISDSFDSIDNEACFDLLVSNPPYIESGEIDSLQPEVSEYEDRVALNGGIDGLDFYPALARAGRMYLRRGGFLVLEIGCEQSDKVKEVLSNEGFEEISVRKDYQGLDRLIKAVNPNNRRGG
jgi:release factor glutamine methyltransferase